MLLAGEEYLISLSPNCGNSVSPNCCNVKFVFASGTLSTITLAVNAGIFSPYFLIFLSAVTVIFFFTVEKKYKVSDLPPSNKEDEIGGVFT